MAWTSETFQRRHGEVGVAAATALVSGLGNLGSITTTYALYAGWPKDAVKGPHQFRKSNLVMVGILGLSITSALVMAVLLRIFGNPPSTKLDNDVLNEPEDGAARREAHQPSNLTLRGIMTDLFTVSLISKRATHPSP